jgi:hypothetical protein
VHTGEAGAFDVAVGDVGYFARPAWVELGGRRMLASFAERGSGTSFGVLWEEPAKNQVVLIMGTLPDRNAVARIIEGLRENDEAMWADLLRRCGGKGDRLTPVDLENLEMGPDGPIVTMPDPAPC